MNRLFSPQRWAALLLGLVLIHPAAAVPVINSISPTSGPANAFTPITLTGLNFGSSVSDITSVSYVSGNTTTTLSFASANTTTPGFAYINSTTAQVVTLADIAPGEAVNFIITIDGTPSAQSAATFTGIGPILTAHGTNPTYTASGSAAVIDGGITIAETGSPNMVSALISIDPFTFVPGDQLNFVDQNGITGSYNSFLGVLALSGSASLANYQLALRSITFSSSAGDPTAGGAFTSRNIGFATSDGTSASLPAFDTVTVSGSGGGGGGGGSSPVINSISPSSGAPNTLTVITINGQNFGSSVSDITSVSYTGINTTTLNFATTNTTTPGFTYINSTTAQVVTQADIAPGEAVDFTITIDHVASTPSSPSSATFTATAGSGPSVSSIVRVGSTPTHASTLSYTVTFSGSVTGVDPTDFTLTATGTATGTVTGVTGSNAVYTVTVGSVTGNGTLRLDLNSSGTGIQDGSLNPITGGFTAGQTYTIDNTAPTVTSVAVPANATYVANQTLSFTVNFSESVAVNTTGGTPSLAVTLDTGGTVQALFSSGNNTSALVFTYVVQAGQVDLTGITLGALTLNGGTLQDSAGNNVNLTLNSVASTTGVLVNGGLAPVIAWSPAPITYGTPLDEWRLS